MYSSSSIEAKVSGLIHENLFKPFCNKTLRNFDELMFMRVIENPQHVRSSSFFEDPRQVQYSCVFEM